MRQAAYRTVKCAASNDWMMMMMMMVMVVMMMMMMIMMIAEAYVAEYEAVCKRHEKGRRKPRKACGK